MYFVLTKKTEATVAMTDFEDIAKQIADNFVEDCVVRWAAGNNNKEEHKNFFKAQA